MLLLLLILLVLGLAHAALSAVIGGRGVAGHLGLLGGAAGRARVTEAGRLEALLWNRKYIVDINMDIRYISVEDRMVLT